MREKSWGRYRNYIGVFIFAVVVGLVPVLAKKYVHVMTLIGIHSIVTMGLCLVMGYAGQISLGQAAFYGLGAYSSAVLTVKFFPRLSAQMGRPDLESWWVWPWVAILIGMVFTAMVTYFIGAPILKLRGNYLAMATLGFGIVVHGTFKGFGLDFVRNITGGGTGIPGVPRLAIGSFALWPKEIYYYLVWATTLVILFLSLNIVNSRVGRALRSVHGSEVAANTLGVDTDRYKLQVLVTSAVFASVAGSFYVHYMTVAAPDAHSYGFTASVNLVVMAAIGGLASIWGAPFGTAAVVLLKDTIRDVMPKLLDFASGEHEIIAFGLILVLIMIFMPEGVTVWLVDAVRRVGRRTVQQPARTGVATSDSSDTSVS